MKRQLQGFKPVNPSELRTLSNSSGDESNRAYHSAVEESKVVEVPNFSERARTSNVHFGYSYQNDAQNEEKDIQDSDEHSVSIHSSSSGSLHSSDGDELERAFLTDEDNSLDENKAEDELKLEAEDQPPVLPPSVKQKRADRLRKAALKTYTWLDNIMTQAWPLAFTGLILNDLGNYYAHPSTRYQTTANDVWFGWSHHPNLATQLNRLGSDLPGETTLFWAPVLTVTAFSLLGLGIGRPVQDYVVTKFNIKSIWSLISQEHKNAKKIAKGVVKSVATIWSLYAYARLLELLIQKFIQYNNYRHDKDSCEAEGKIFDLVSRLGNYACAVCPEWDEILLKDIYTSQDCLQGLLATERSAQNILNRVTELAQYNDLTELDFSRQNILAWSDEVFASILSVLTRPGLPFRLNLTISADSLQPFPVAKFNSITQFLSQTNSTRSLDVSNQQLGPQLGLRLMNSLPLSIESFTAVNSALGGSVTALGQSLLNLNVGYNGVNDLQVQALFTNVIVANATSLQLSGNQLGDLSAITIGTKLNRTQITRLGLSSLQGLTVKGLIPLGQGVMGSMLLDLDLSNNNLDQREVIGFSPYLKNSTLQYYNFSINNLVASYAVKQFLAGLPASLKSLTIFDVNLDDGGVTELAAFIKKNSLQSVDISKNNFSIDGWNTLIPALVQSKVEEFAVRNNLLTPSHLSSFSASLNNATTSALTSVDIGNNSDLDDNSLIVFLDACAKSGVTKIILSNTDASDAVANKIAALLKSGYALNYLDINNSGITRAGVMTILEAAVGSQLRTFKSAHIELTDSDLYQASQLLLKAPDDLSYLGKQLNQDERRNLASAVPVIPLTNWDFSTVGPNGRGLIAFNEAQQFTLFNESAVASRVTSSLTDRAVNSTSTTNTDLSSSRSGLSANAELISYVAGVSLFIFLLRSLLKPARKYFFSKPEPANQIATDELSLTKTSNQLTR